MQQHEFAARSLVVKEPVKRLLSAEVVRGGAYLVGVLAALLFLGGAALDVLARVIGLDHVEIVAGRFDAVERAGVGRVKHALRVAVPNIPAAVGDVVKEIHGLYGDVDLPVAEIVLSGNDVDVLFAHAGVQQERNHPLAAAEAHGGPLLREAPHGGAVEVIAVPVRQQHEANVPEDRAQR